MPIEFPPVTEADEHGLLAVGGNLELETLVNAYSSGIFPWPLDAKTLAWFAPPQRTLLFLEEFHLARSLAKTMKRSDYGFAINRNFAGVVDCCAESINRPGQRGTWITGAIKRAYLVLHRAGLAHSFECYEGEELVGGAYGVSLGGVFAAESMFYRRSNASKMVLVYLTKYFSSHSVPWIDAQVMNPFLASMGFREISREDFMPMLDERLKLPAIPFPKPENSDPLVGVGAFMKRG